MATWEFQNLQWIARTNGWTEFISMQNYHTLLYREEEREMMPYCRHAGVAVIPWSPLARDVLKQPWSERGSKGEQSDNFLKSLIRKRESEVDKAIVDRVEEVARKHGVSMACITTSWGIYKGCCPIIGLGSKERIDQAMANTNFQLSEEDAKYLEEPYLPKPVQAY
jgi:aryl-alcohol dehydrogenase-like predicted oxidoreductase